MNCPHCGSLTTTRLAAKTSLGYSTFRCSRKCQDSGHAIFPAMFNPSHPRSVGPKARAIMLLSARIVRHQIAAGTYGAVPLRVPSLWACCDTGSNLSVRQMPGRNMMPHQSSRILALGNTVALCLSGPALTDY